MQAFVWPSIGFYCLLGVFVFYQQLHGRSFVFGHRHGMHANRGANVALGFAVNVSALIGTTLGVVYLGYYAWQVSWWAAIVVFTIGVIAAMAGTLTERLVGPAPISLAGFVGIPLCAYFMFALVS